MTILVAGAGIGGLAAALALSRAGFAVRVFEARQEPSEAGAGIQISANGVKALDALELADEVAAIGFRPEAVELRLPGSGRVVSRIELGRAHEARYGRPYLHIHRADLHRVLYDAVRLHPLCRVETGRAVEAVEDRGARVAVRFAGGEQAEGAALIGADGIRSAVRAFVTGAESPRFTGQTAWRAVVPAAGLEPLINPCATVWMGEGKHLVHYYVRRGELVNLVGVVERGQWTSESWTQAGTADEMRADFGGWSRGIDAALERVGEVWRWALFDRPAFSPWSRGRATLLGDACHPMLPFLAQGAVMALEDAVVLARRLAERPEDPAAAFAAYEALRRDRTARVQKAAWANASRFHLKGSIARTAVYGALGVASRVAPGRGGGGLRLALRLRSRGRVSRNADRPHRRQEPDGEPHDHDARHGNPERGLQAQFGGEPAEQDRSDRRPAHLRELIDRDEPAAQVRRRDGLHHRARGGEGDAGAQSHQSIRP